MNKEQIYIVTLVRDKNSINCKQCKPIKNGECELCPSHNNGWLDGNITALDPEKEYDITKPGNIIKSFASGDKIKKIIEELIRNKNGNHYIISNDYNEHANKREIILACHPDIVISIVNSIKNGSYKH